MQFSVPWVRSRSVWVCKAVLPAGGCGAVSWRQVVKETENTHGKGTGRSSRELIYITRSWLVTYKAVNKTPTIKVNLRVSCCALCYRGDPCCEFGTPAVLSVRESKRPECSIRAPLFPCSSLLMLTQSRPHPTHLQPRSSGDFLGGKNSKNNMR